MSEKEYYFSFDTNKCVLCHACETACKIHNNVETGCTWRKVKTIWYGEYPEISGVNLSISCMHCVDPECLKICPEQAITKNSEGIVSVDRDKCTGCGLCYKVCPVKAPQFGWDKKMQKCDFCFGRIEKGTAPVCVETCPGGAIGFEFADISNKIGSEKDMAEYFVIKKP